jgi:hypothetical protein
VSHRDGCLCAGCELAGRRTDPIAFKVEAIIARWWQRTDRTDAEKQAIEDQLRTKFGVPKR